MAEICRLLGMSVQMIYDDHDNPHIHIYLGRSELAVVQFDGIVRRGYLEPNKLRALRTWLKKRQNELIENWERAKNSIPVERIEP